MAFLIGLQLMNGEWDNFVVARFPKPNISGSADLLGRTLPCFQYIEAYDGVAKDEAMRLAHTLQGTPKESRREAFLQRAKALRKDASGGTMA